MIVVQAAGCAPIVRAFEQGAERAEFWQNAATISSGLRVPKPLGDFLILRAVRSSNGACIAIPDREALAAGVEAARLDGVFPAPEGAACSPPSGASCAPVSSNPPNALSSTTPALA